MEKKSVKTCTKCSNEHPATLEYFGLEKRVKNGLQAQCRKCHRKRSKEYGQTEAGKARQIRFYQIHSDYRKEYYQRTCNIRLQEMKKYNNTIKGHLRHLYGDIKRRCSGESKNPKDAIYIKRGIKCLFTSGEFVDYVINDMKIDPRGLQIHRIDNDKHYEKGNIVFRTAIKHRQLHKRKINNGK